MSYTIVFETKILKLNDGRIMHFSRTGCNNDDFGRKKNEFKANVYGSENDFIKYVETFKGNTDEYVVLKIGNKFGTLDDYYKHLVRMLKRGKTEDQFVKEFNFEASYVDSIDVIKPEKVTLTPEEFNDKFYTHLRQGLTYHINKVRYSFDDMDKIIDAMNNGKDVWFEIRRKK